MRILDAPGLQPAEELAWEEIRLEELNAGSTGESLRFWEASTPCVVVGLANRVDVEANRPFCSDAGIPILRRASGGGTVLQGPGCLNYSLALSIRAGEPLDSVSGANDYILNRIRDALGTIVDDPVEIRGHTDLAIQGRKFSGNAQKRKRRALLFHGTLLLPAFDLAAIGRCLQMPPKQPGYREKRSHSDFVRCLPASRENVIRALKQAWNATESEASAPTRAINRLVREKYSQADWNFRR